MHNGAEGSFWGLLLLLCAPNYKYIEINCVCLK